MTQNATPADAGRAQDGPASMPCDVVIVGAGPTGLMAAALLRRCGLEVRILDKSPTQAKESRAFGIQARSMELFEQIGLADTLMDRGLMASGAQVFVGGKAADELNFDDIGRADTPYQFLLMVPQSEIEEILAADVARHGVSVERGVEVTGLDQADRGVTVHARTSSGSPLAVRGRYLIGADGAHSIVRKALGLSFAGAPYPQSFFLADCHVDWALDYDHFKLFLHQRGLGLFLPLKGKRIARVMALDPHAAETDLVPAAQGSSSASLPEIEAAFRQAANCEVRLSDAVWTSRYRVHHRGVDRYRVDRAFVAGDAAHIHSPAGGQGMNTGLQDAANLAWKLACVLKSGADPSILDTYHAERWPVGHRVLEYTDRIFSFMTAQSGWAASLRPLVMPLFASTVSRVGTARNRAFHFISQLGIRYDESATVRDAASPQASKAFRNGPAAGRRAPNARVNRRLDVFDLIAGYRFHVLALSRKPLSDEEIGRLADELESLANTGVDLGTDVIAHSLRGRDPRIIQAEASEVFDAYGVDASSPQALYLIRPDNHVAWRSDGLRVAACKAFIEATFVSKRT